MYFIFEPHEYYFKFKVIILTESTYSFCTHIIVIKGLSCTILKILTDKTLYSRSPQFKGHGEKLKIICMFLSMDNSN